MAIRIGTAELTLLAKHLCRLLAKYRTPINTAISNAVTAGKITSAQATTVMSFLDLADAACDILRLVTGY